MYLDCTALFLDDCATNHLVKWQDCCYTIELFYIGSIYSYSAIYNLLIIMAYND